MGDVTGLLPEEQTIRKSTPETGMGGQGGMKHCRPGTGLPLQGWPGKIAAGWEGETT